jgi:anti-repressor protein
METVEIFKNPEFGEVRTLMVNNEPWFVGKDVAEALGYARTADAVAAHVDAEDKGVGKIPTPGGEQDVTIINESGLYSLVLSSKLPTAKQFKRWVTHEVIPSIRKHGMYATDGLLAKATQDPDFLIGLLNNMKDERKKRLEAESKLHEAHPKIVFADAVSVSSTSILIFDLAKLLKQNGVEIGGRRLFEKLREGGYLIKSGSSKNMPTQRAMDMGLFVIKEGSYINGQGVNVTTKTTKVTGKGHLYFINKFLSGDLKKAE